MLMAVPCRADSALRFFFFYKTKPKLLVASLPFPFSVAAGDKAFTNGGEHVHLAAQGTSHVCA